MEDFCSTPVYTFRVYSKDEQDKVDQRKKKWTHFKTDLLYLNLYNRTWSVYHWSIFFLIANYLLLSVKIEWLYTILHFNGTVQHVSQQIFSCLSLMTFFRSPFFRPSSVQFSRSVVSDSLRPYGLQHARPPCPPPTPRVYSNSCPFSQWCHPTISSSVIPFSCLQSFPALGSFQMSQFFTSGGQSIGVSTSVSVHLMNIQEWYRSGLTGWISLQSKGLSTVFSITTVQKHRFFGAQISL